MEGENMRVFIHHIMTAAMILITAATACPQEPAATAKEEIGAALGLSAKPAANKCVCPEQTKKPVADKSRKKTVHRYKGVNTKSRNGLEREPAPGAKLTMKQVMDLLKTTRNFAGKNLSGLRLVGCDLTRCNFKGADLSNAELTRADFRESNLETADLSGADMEMTDLRLTGMKGARLENTRLDGSLWPDNTICAKGSVGSCLESVVPYPVQ